MNQTDPAPLTELETKPQSTPYGVFTPAEMRKAFDQVQDPDNWKNPISAVIPIQDLPCLAAAVEFFQGTQLQVSAHVDGWEVSSPGYQG